MSLRAAFRKQLGGFTSPFTAGCVYGCSTPAPQGNVSVKQEPTSGGGAGAAGGPAALSPRLLSAARPWERCAWGLPPPGPLPSAKPGTAVGDSLGFRNGHWSVPRLWSGPGAGLSPSTRRPGRRPHLRTVFALPCSLPDGVSFPRW